jgi:hypothetical protein
MSRSPRSTGASAVPRTASHPLAHLRHRARLGGTFTSGAPKPRSFIVIAAAGAGCALLVAACSNSAAQPGSAGAPVLRPAVHAAANGPAAASLPVAAPEFGGVSGAVGTKSAQRPLSANVAELVKLSPSRSIIYTANLTLRIKDNDVDSVAAVAANEVAAVGGYVASEQDVAQAGPGTIGQVDLELKIPVAAYHQVFGELTALGKVLSRTQQAQDVTQEVADVSSRVASAKAAIRQLRALLSRAGNVGQLLSVQDEINSQESALESLIAQQSALAHETTYATAYLTLLGHQAPVHKKHHKKARHGLGAGLSTGWRALKAVVVWLLTALGTALPFAVPVLVIGGIVWIGRRRVTRRRTPAAAPPATAPPAATS